MKKVLALWMIVVAGSDAIGQDLGSTFQVTPFAGLHGYSWGEFEDGGQEVLKESGPMYLAGALSRLAFLQNRNLFTELELQYAFGTVDYNGFLMDQLGNRTPYSSQTVYSRIEISAHAGFIFKLSKTFQLTPIAGFGFEYWNRDLDKGGRFGYDEKYTVFLVNIGVIGTYVVSPAFQAFAGVALEVPLSISESIDLASRGQGGPSDVSLSPGINPRFRIKTGGSIYRVYAMFYFDTWTLSKSNVDQGFLQPESTRKQFGFKLGYTIGFW